MTRTIDGSRYRVAESIAGRWEAGESAASIGEDYFGPRTFNGIASATDRTWIIELIVAAHDRKGKYEPRDDEAAS